MERKHWAHELRAFTTYKSADGTEGVTGATAGVTFKNGLYVGGNFSAVGLPINTDNVSILGVDGDGYIQFASQSVRPGLAPAHIYASSDGRIVFGHSGSQAYDITLNNALLSDHRVYNVQNKSGTFAMTDDNVSQFTNDSGYITTAALANYVQGPASAVSGSLPTFNGTTGKLIQDSGIAASSVVLNTRTIAEGAGLAGNTYDLSANRTLALGTPSTLTAATTNSASGTTHTHEITGFVPTTRTITEGSGLAGNTYDLSANRTLALGTPSTLSLASINGASGTTHTHAITSSSNPGASASLLASDVSGGLQLVSLSLSGNFTPSGFVAGHLIPSVTDTYDLGSSSKLWRKGWLSEMDAVLFAKNTVSLVGGWLMLTKNEGTIPVSQDIGTGDTSIDFGQAMTLDDFVLFRAAGAVEYVKVISLSAGTRYNVTRNLDGSGANAWPAGSVYAVLGNTGNGRIELNANSTPRINMFTQGSAYNTQTEMLRVGDLNGNWGYSAETYGFAVGNYPSGQAWFSADSTNGVRLGIGTSVHIALTPTDAQFTNLIKMTGAGAALSLGATPPTSPTAGTGVWIDRNGIYSLSSNTQNVTLTQAGLSAGQGSVTLDSGGLTIAGGILQRNSIRWVATGGDTAGANIRGTFDTSKATLQSTAGVGNDTTQMAVNSLVALGGNLSEAHVNVYAGSISHATHPESSFIVLGGNNDVGGVFKGVAIRPDLLETAPTHMLDVYGSGWFQTTLQVDGAATFNAHGWFKSTLQVDGAATFNAHGWFKSTQQVDGAATFNAHGWFKSTQQVDGAATFNGTATFNGAAAFNGVSTFNSNLTMSGAALVPATSTGTALFGMDLSAAATFQVLAANTRQPFGNSNNFSGLLIINDPSVTGSTGMFLVGLNIVKVSESATTAKYSTVAGTAGRINVYLNASNAVEIQNSTGTAIDFRIMAIRMRPVV